MKSSLRLLGSAILFVGVAALPGCPQQAPSEAITETMPSNPSRPPRPTRDEPPQAAWALSVADALAIARAEDEALNPMGDELFEERVLVELVRVPGHEAGVFHASFITEIEGADEPSERRYFVDAEDGTLLDASTIALLGL